MIPTSIGQLVQDMLRIFSRGFNSFTNMIGLIFTSFIRVSPLPDEIDFILIVLLLLWLVIWLARLISGK